MDSFCGQKVDPSRR